MKSIFVVIGKNNLINAVGPVGAAFTREEAEEVAKQKEWICDETKIFEVSVYEKSEGKL